jgi:hypothetical protein
MALFICTLAATYIALNSGGHAAIIDADNATKQAVLAVSNQQAARA